MYQLFFLLSSLIWGVGLYVIGVYVLRTRRLHKWLHPFVSVRQVGITFAGLGLLGLLLAGLPYFNEYPWGSVGIWVLGLTGYSVLGYTLWQRWPAPFAFLPEHWALAATAPIARAHAWNPILLAGHPPTAQRRRQARRYVRKQWQIRNVEEWQETVDWLLEEGQRLAFHEEISHILRLDDAELAAYLVQVDKKEVASEGAPSAMEQHARIQWVCETGSRLARQSFLAWDLLRLIMLSRWAYRAEWIDEDMAMSHVLMASQALQQRYNSWEELYECYLAGLRYWSMPQFEALSPGIEEGIAKEKALRYSLWKRIPWRYELVFPQMYEEDEAQNDPS